ncbi:hypothetical protein MIMGU_mgv1a0173371mg, partial [Erythranthe guttata]
MTMKMARYEELRIALGNLS